MKTEIETIDITPEWKGMIPMFVHWIESGNTSQKKLAIEEITRLATIVDHFMKHRGHTLSCNCGEEFDFCT